MKMRERGTGALTFFAGRPADAQKLHCRAIEGQVHQVHGHAGGYDRGERCNADIDRG